MSSLSARYPTTAFWTSSLEEYHHPEPVETWKRLVVETDAILWISDKGECIWKETLINIAPARGTYTIKSKPYAPAKLIALAFKVPGYEKLSIPGMVATTKDDSHPLSLTNIMICTRGDVVRKNTIVRDSKGFYEPPVRNGVTGVVFEPGYAVYPDGIVFSLYRSKKEPVQLECSVDNDRTQFRGTKDTRRMYVDILVLMSFGDLKGQSYDEALNQYNIIHQNGNLRDDRLENLAYKGKTPSIEAQRKAREDARKKKLVDNIVMLLEKRKATLVTPKETILTGATEFEYQCPCGPKKTCYNYLQESETCQDCAGHKLRETTADNPNEYVTFIQDNKEYVRFKCGWASKDGTILNNMKKEVPIIKGYICICDKRYNVKSLLAYVFKIPNYEKLEQEGYNVFQHVLNDDYSIDNLIIRTQSKDTVIRRREKNEQRDHLELNGVQQSYTPHSSLVSVREVQNVESKTHPDFPDIVFYANGIIKSSIGNYVTGNKDQKTGYYKVTINSKSYKIHRLICFVFNPIEGKTKLSDYDDLEVDHLDHTKGKSCNDRTNLKWVTPSENRKAGVKHNLYKANKAVIQYNVNPDKSRGTEVRRFAMMKEAIAELHISSRKLASILKTNEPYKNFIYVLASSVENNERSSDEEDVDSDEED